MAILSRTSLTATKRKFTKSASGIGSRRPFSHGRGRASSADPTPTSPVQSRERRPSAARQVRVLPLRSHPSPTRKSQSPASGTVTALPMALVALKNVRRSALLLMPPEIVFLRHPDRSLRSGGTPDPSLARMPRPLLTSPELGCSVPRDFLPASPVMFTGEAAPLARIRLLPRPFSHGRGDRAQRGR